jgi:hypothetical protein
LSQVVKLPGVVEYGMVPLLEIQEFLQLVVEQTRKQMTTKGGAEFVSWNMMILR